MHGNSMEKVGTINKRVYIGLHRNPHRFWPDKKKADPMTRLVSIFCHRPAGRPDKKLSVESPTSNIPEGISFHNP